MAVTDFAIADCAIRQLHARYADAVWRRDFAAFVDCFAADAEWKIAGLRIRGRDEIGSHIRRFLAPSARVLISFASPALQLGDGTAIARTYTTEQVKRLDGQGISTVGIYYERMADQGDRWRFQWRHFDLHYYGPADLSAQPLDRKDYGPAPGMPGPDDPATARVQAVRGNST